MLPVFQYYTSYLSAVGSGLVPMRAHAFMNSKLVVCHADNMHENPRTKHKPNCLELDFPSSEKGTRIETYSSRFRTR